MVRRTAQGSNPNKEKIKWALVAVLGIMLLVVWYYNLRSSGSRVKDLNAQAEPAHNGDYGILLSPENESMPSLKALTAEPEPADITAPAKIHNIFSFASRNDFLNTAVTDPPEGDELILRGTIIDGDNSIAYINDWVLGLGDSVSDFTVVAITAGRATIRKGDEVLTVLAKEDVIDENT